MTHRHRASVATPRALVLLPSGGILDLMAPDPWSWTDEDLALGLARTYRWGGHSAWPLPLSVAQHSLTVLAIREQSSPIAPGQAHFELLHDGEEGLLGFDCIAPLKAALGQPFRDVCDRLSAAIAIRYQLPSVTAGDYRLHKQADRIAAASEALHVVRWTEEQIETTLGLEEAPLEYDPLMGHLSQTRYGAWEPWTAEDAATRWQGRLAVELARNASAS